MRPGVGVAWARLTRASAPSQPKWIGLPRGSVRQAPCSAAGGGALHGARQMKHKVRRIHFVGIGGAGMSGIAEVLVNLGYQVSGSDLAVNTATRRLASLGVRLSLAHPPADVDGARAVVGSPPVRPDNPPGIPAPPRRPPRV